MLYNKSAMRNQSQIQNQDIGASLGIELMRQKKSKTRKIKPLKWDLRKTSDFTLTRQTSDEQSIAIQNQTIGASIRIELMRRTHIRTRKIKPENGI